MSMPQFPAIPPAVGEVFRTLWQEIQNIHLTWTINRQLFGTSPERVALLNRFGGVAFGLFEQLLTRHTVLAIFRLVDPARQRAGRDQNLSLDRLVDVVTANDAACGAKLVPVLAQIRAQMAPHADLRNKIVAHNDLHTLPTLYDGTSTVYAPSRATMEAVLEGIRTLMNIVQINYGEGESGYYNTAMSELGDGDTLIANLNELAMRIDNDPDPRWVRMQKYRCKI